MLQHVWLILTSALEKSFAFSPFSLRGRWPPVKAGKTCGSVAAGEGTEREHKRKAQVTPPAQHINKHTCKKPWRENNPELHSSNAEVRCFTHMRTRAQVHRRALVCVALFVGSSVNLTPGFRPFVSGPSSWVEVHELGSAEHRRRSGCAPPHQAVVSRFIYEGSLWLPEPCLECGGGTGAGEGRRTTSRQQHPLVCWLLSHCSQRYRDEILRPTV